MGKQIHPSPKFTSFNISSKIIINNKNNNKNIIPNVIFTHSSQFNKNITSPSTKTHTSNQSNTFTKQHHSFIFTSSKFIINNNKLIIYIHLTPHISNNK